MTIFVCLAVVAAVNDDDDNVTVDYNDFVVVVKALAAIGISNARVVVKCWGIKLVVRVRYY